MSKTYLDAESRFRGGYSGQLLNTLAQAYRPYRIRCLFWMVLGFIARLSLLGCINLLGLWADSFCRNGDHCRPIPSLFQGWASADWLRLLFGMAGFGLVFTLLFRANISRLSAHAVSRIYDETTYRVSRAPMVFFDRNPVGRIVTRFSSDYNNLFRIFGGPITEFIQLIFDLVAMSILVFVASPWLTPFWALLAILSFAIYRLQVGTLRKERRELSARRSPAIAHFAETAQGASTIRAFGREETFTNRFRELNDGFLEQRLRVQTILFRFFVSLQGVSPLVFFAVGLSGLILVPQGLMSAGDLGVAFAYLGLAVIVFGSFFEWLGQFEEALTGLERMDQYLRLPLEPGSGLPAQSEFETGHPRATHYENPSLPADVRQTPAAAVEVDHLWFRYREDLPFVLTDLHFRLEPGMRLGVVGRTGSGKSSLIQALLQLYPIERGQIRVDGKYARMRGRVEDPSPNAVGIEQYRRLFSWISQEPTLFRGTLRENLGSPERTDAERIEALQRVGLVDEADGPRFLDHLVEERGRNLSAGERQLVCMARCLLEDAPVLILDEATSAIDPQSEELLTRATETFFRGRTQIVIAHRLSTIESCDLILWLDAGKVRMLGSPTEVLPAFRAYRRSEARDETAWTEDPSPRP